MQNPILKLTNITKDFPGVRALDHVSFDVLPDEIHAICGENGAGKSTLIKILAGVHPHGTFDGRFEFDQIECRLKSVRSAEKIGLAVIHQELNLVPEMSVAENIFLGREPLTQMYRYTFGGVIDLPKLYRHAGQLLKKFGLDLSVTAPIRSLGVGQKQLVEIAKALSQNARLLILDEPTAALTESEIDHLLSILRELRRQNVSSIYISHKLNELFRIADRVTVLRNGKRIGTLPISECNEAKLISMMVGRELRNDLEPPEIRSEKIALKIRDLDLFLTDRKVIDNVSFDVKFGEIVGIAGLMGAGRTELISAIFGAFGKIDGKIEIDGNEVEIQSPHDAIRNGIGFVSEDRQRFGLILDHTIEKNMTLSHLDQLSKNGIVDPISTFKETDRFVDELQIRTPSIETVTKNLSGGNQQKVVIGKCLMTKPKILFLDEPTRGIDVGAKSEIYQLIFRLAQQGVTIVIISSELPELIAISHRILVLRNGRMVGEFPNRNLTQEMIMACATGTI